MSKQVIVKIDLNNKKYGGRIYENEIVGNLSHEFEFKRVFLLKHSIKVLNIPRIFTLYLYYKFFFRGNLMLTNHTTWFAGNKCNNLLIVHHIDTSSSHGMSGLFQKFCDKSIVWNKKKYSKIVTVASYWKKELENMGFNNIKVIYNSFDPTLYSFSTEEIQEFKNKYNLLDKPIIYLGNCQRQKGVVEAYDALKDLDCHFITTGIKDVDIPAKHFDFSYRDYRLMLASADIVVCMSQLIEGWNRTAHEALLSNTKVIGSGTGGMRELLELGGGEICANPKNLLPLVKKSLADASNKNMSRRILSLDKKYFLSEWRRVLHDFVDRISI